MPNITLEEASRICDAAVTKAREMGVKVSISVVDSGQNLVTMQRMDGAIMLGIEGGKGKAVASSLFGKPSGELEQLADRPVFRALMTQMGGKLIMGIGAIPIVKDGEVIGACGVGGGTGQEDEDCANAGVAAL